MDKDRIIKELNLTSFGQKGWVRSDSLECPECSGNQKSGILFLKGGGIFKCMKCGYSTSLFKFLLKSKRSHLLGGIKDAPLLDTLPELFVMEEEKGKKQKISYPLGYKEISNSEYLNNRKFLKEHYEIYRPGIAAMEPKLSEDYLVFLLFKGEELVGWLARSKKDKKWHKENLKLAKLGKAKLNLRWYNASGVDFTDILGGFNLITKETETLVLVEGLFDATSVDNAIEIGTQTHLRCCFTFGDSISNEQIRLIKEETNVKNIVLLYDFDTAVESKVAALKLSREFNVFVSDINKETDPGDMSGEEILSTILDSRPYFEYFTNKLNKIKII